MNENKELSGKRREDENMECRVVKIDLRADRLGSVYRSTWYAAYIE